MTDPPGHPCPASQLHFARGFRFVGHLVVIVFRILFVDIVKWGSVYLIIVPGFGIALFLLVRDQWLNQTTGLVDENFASIASAIYRLFRHRRVAY